MTDAPDPLATSGKRPRRKRSWTGIRARLALLFVLGAIPVATAMAVLVRGEREAAIQYEYGKLRYVAAEIAVQEDHVTEFSRQLLLSLSADPAVRSATNPECAQALAAGRKGRETYFANIAVAKPSGELVCSAVTLKSVVTWKDSAPFREALASHQVVVGDALVGPVTGKPIVPLFLANRDAQGAVQSVLIVGLDLEWLKKPIDAVGFPKTTIVGVMNLAGRVIFRHPDAGVWTGRDISATPFGREVADHKRHGLVEMPGLNGEDRIVAFQRFGTEIGEKLTFWVAVPTKDVIAAAPKTSLLAGVVTALLLLVLLIALWLASDQMILHPVERLTEAFQRLATGDLSAKVRLQQSSGELARLAHAFDRTVESLATMSESVRTNRALKVLLAVKATRATTDSEADLLRDICRAIIDAGGYAIVWVGRAKDDVDRTIELVHWIGPGQELLLAEKLSWGDNERGQGATGTAIREGRLVTSDELSAAQTNPIWQRLGETLGLQSAIALPLRGPDGHVAGSLTMYAMDAGAFGTTEAQLLAEMAADVMAKVDALRERLARRHVQEELAASESLLARAEAIGYTGSWRMDLLTGQVTASDGLLRIGGVDSVPAFATPEGLLSFVHPDDRDWVRRAYIKATRTGEDYDVQHRICTGNGGIRHVRSRSVSVRGRDGVISHTIGTLRDITDEVEVRGALAERVKEMRCLLAVFRETDRRDLPIDEVIRNVAALTRQGWRYEVDTQARIRLGNLEAATPGFVETPWMLQTRFSTRGAKGDLTVVYLHPHDEHPDGAFLPEEVELLKAIAARLSDMCAAREAEATLKEREERYSAIVNQARDAVVTVDRGTAKFVDFNEVAHASLGYTREEFLQMGIADLDAALAPDELAAAVRRMGEPEGASVETQIRHRDGSLRDVRVSARPITVAGHAYLAAIWSDMTEAKAKEEELRQMSQNQQMLANANRAILYGSEEAALMRVVCEILVAQRGYTLAWLGEPLNDAEKTVKPLVFVGEAADYIAGLQISWGLGRYGHGPTGEAFRSGRPVRALDIVTDERYAPWRESALQHGYQSSIAIPLLDAQGQVFLCLCVYASRPDAFGEEETKLLLNLADSLAFGVRGLRDRKAREATEQENRKLSLVIEQSPSSVMVTNLDGQIEYVNPAFLHHTGYTVEELLGKNPRELQSGKTPRATFEAMWAALSRGEIWQGEFINQRKDGTEYTELATLAPIRNEKGRVTHYVAIKDDITERKRMSDELEKHRHHLEELVGIRTAELQEAQQRAESASLAKSAFLANMSHEIRTPLNAIIGLTHLLGPGSQTPEHAERLRKIDASARHLLAIINDILDLSKVEAGKLRVENVDFELEEVLAGVRDSLTDRAQEKGLSLSIVSHDGLPTRLNGDPLRLMQILLNLATNAVKFTSHGNVTLRVRRDTEVPGPLSVRFEVSDTGIGMSEDQIQRLFQPFEQADVSTTRKYGGTGLGLAICRRLVELMRGTIGVNSVVGEGSTFWVTLPFGRAASYSEEAARSAISGSVRAVRADRSPEDVRILLVEDDLINQEVASELLTTRGFVVDVAANGALAVEMAGMVEYDAVLMDVQMPVMDGLTATRQLRLMDAYTQRPILAMTASAFAEDKEACINAGMDDFVSKPINPEAFFTTICRWTGAKVTKPTQAALAGLGPSAAEVRQRLEAIPGLDAEAGLHVVQERWETYERLLRKFASERADDVARLRAHIAATRWEDARREAHTLKGVSGTLGAHAVRAAAAAVEDLLARDDHGGAALADHVAELSELHANLVAALNAALPEWTAKVVTVVDWPAVRASIARLEQLLADDDVRALQTFRTELPMLRAALGAAAEALERAVEAFEFDDALTQLRAAVALEPRLAG